MFGEDEKLQKEQLKDYLEAGAKLLVINTDYTEDRENKIIMRELKNIDDLEYLIFNKLSSLGTDINWILRLIDSLNKKKVKLYSDELGMTFDDYNLSYTEFISTFLDEQRKLSNERAKIVRKNSDRSTFNFGRPRTDLDSNTLASTIKEYESGILTGKSAATSLGISESTFRKRLYEYRKEKNY